MSADLFARLIDFLERLDKAKIRYELRHGRYDAISVIAHAPSEYWEVDFLTEGEVEIERFRSDGRIHDESVLEELFALCSDEAPTPVETGKREDSVARK